MDFCLLPGILSRWIMGCWINAWRGRAFEDGDTAHHGSMLRVQLCKSIPIPSVMWIYASIEKLWFWRIVDGRLAVWRWIRLWLWECSLYVFLWWRVGYGGSMNWQYVELFYWFCVFSVCWQRCGVEEVMEALAVWRLVWDVDEDVV